MVGTGGICQQREREREGERERKRELPFSM
jgi:hypothetical protein